MSRLGSFIGYLIKMFFREFIFLGFTHIKSFIWVKRNFSDRFLFWLSRHSYLLIVFFASELLDLCNLGRQLCSPGKLAIELKVLASKSTSLGPESMGIEVPSSQSFPLAASLNSGCLQLQWNFFGESSFRQFCLQPWSLSQGWTEICNVNSVI